MIAFITSISGVACIGNNRLMQMTSTQDETGNFLWKKINETTWWYDNKWAGESYIFYEDNHGFKKCIHQVMGSGIYIVSREFVDFEIIDEYKIKIANTLYTLVDNAFISEKNTLTLYANKPLVYDRKGLMDIDKVKSDEFIVGKIE